MKLISTNSFKLAINQVGNKDSSKLILLLPGRLDTKDYQCFVDHSNFLANKGYLVVSLDPPGTWDSPGGVELFTTTNYIKAVNELIEYFDNKATFLMGHSRGGAISILVGSSNPYVVGFVAVMANFEAPSSPENKIINQGYDVSYRDIPPGTSKTDERVKFKLPLNYFIDGQKYNAGEVLKTCIKPKLLFYGTNDEFNKPDEVEEIFKTFSEPKELYKLDCNHDYRYYPEVVERVNKVTDIFLKKYFK